MARQTKQKKISNLIKSFVGKIVVRKKNIKLTESMIIEELDNYTKFFKKKISKKNENNQTPSQFIKTISYIKKIMKKNFFGSLIVKILYKMSLFDKYYGFDDKSVINYLLDKKIKFDKYNFNDVQKKIKLFHGIN